MHYNVLKNLKHNHVRYAPGSIAELDEDVAAPLVRDGVVAERPESVEVSEPKKAAPKAAKGKAAKDNDNL